MSSPHPPPGPPLAALRGVGKRFPNGTRALAGVDLAIGRGEFLSVLGPSGCGKSTLLRLVAGLTEPSEGALEFAAGAGGSGGGAASASSSRPPR